MDKTIFLEHLAQAERHVAMGEAIVMRQREIVSALEANGHTELASKARRLLAIFEELHATHIAGRDRLQQELVDFSASSA
jgi:hypothetical protein